MERVKPAGSRVPKDRAFYNRLLPAMIIILAFIMTALIAFATAVLLGLIPFN